MKVGGISRREWAGRLLMLLGVSGLGSRVETGGAGERMDPSPMGMLEPGRAFGERGAYRA